MNLFKSVFIMFFSLFIFVSNGVGQEEILNQTFLLAVQDGDLEHVEYLLMSGVDINTTDEFGRNALMMLVGYRRNWIQMLNLLIAKRIDVNATDPQGKTALSYSGLRGVFPPAPSYKREVLLEVGVQWTDADRRHLDFVREIHQSMKKNEDSFVREANEVFDEQSRDRFLRSRP